jgi:predicted Rossmann-fold nucleotide-binding protein
MTLQWLFMTEQNRPVITAFGSSRITADDTRFKDAEALSTKVAQAGWSGLVGGHQGMMAAFSHGVRDGGG